MCGGRKGSAFGDRSKVQGWGFGKVGIEPYGRVVDNAGSGVCLAFGSWVDG